MGRSANTIRTGTSTWFGPRDTGGLAGVLKTEGAQNELSIDITGQTLNDLVISPCYVPVGAVITKAYLMLDEAFNLQAASVLEIGTSGSEVTNGVSITEAQLEGTAPDYVDLTTALAGTWDNEVVFGTAAKIGIAFSAGGLTASVGKASGKARVVIEYLKVNG